MPRRHSRSRRTSKRGSRKYRSSKISLLPAELKAKTLSDCKVAGLLETTSKSEEIDEDTYQHMLRNQFNVGSFKDAYNRLCQLQHLLPILEEINECKSNFSSEFHDLAIENALSQYWQYVRNNRPSYYANDQNELIYQKMPLPQGPRSERVEKIAEFWGHLEKVDELVTQQISSLLDVEGEAFA